MKKFLKVFIVVLSVLAVICGTVYFFFRKHEEKKNTSEPILALVNSESVVKFKNDLDSLSDDRIDLIETTNNNLNNIVLSLSSYYIETNTQIKDEGIASQYRTVVSSRNLLSDMIREYNIKKESNYFDEVAGGNDLFKQSCNYLVQYAKLVKMINANVSGIDKTADVKFSVIEIYCDIVVKDLSSTVLDNYKGTTSTDDDKLIVENSNGIEKINEIMNLNPTNNFTLNANKFVEFYRNCDKSLFAKDFAINFDSVTSNDKTNEKLATYYLKLVYGI